MGRTHPETPITSAMLLDAAPLVPPTAATSASTRWAGRILTGLAVSFRGAIATHLRVDDPLLSHVLFPTYVAAVIWGGLYLRDGRLRALLRPAR